MKDFMNQMTRGPFRDWYKFKKSEVWVVGDQDYCDVIIESMKSIVVTTYDGGDLHILDVRATDLQQALETDTYL